VIDAFIDLALEEGRLPTTAEVGKRACVSMATLFRYFETLDDLRRGAATRLFQRFPHLYGVKNIGEGTLEDRIARFAATRVELWETTHPLALQVRAHSRRDRGASELVDMARTAMANLIRQHFDAELRGMTRTRREDAVASIAVLTSVESWEQFRHVHDRSPLQIRRAWTRSIDRILDDA